jgi:sugar phosphate isomerase/epimerase
MILANFAFGLDGVDFSARLLGAVAGGFDGIALNVEEYARLREQGLTDTEMATMLDDHGLAIMELEALHRWGRIHEPDERTPGHEKLLEHVSGTFTVPHAVVIGYYDGSFDEAVHTFGDLCDRMAHTGVRLALEFLPFTEVATAWDAVSLLQEADRPNGALCVDIWHHTRGGADWAALEALPERSVATIQLNDGPVTPTTDDYYLETMHRRLIPGAGEFAIDWFLDVMDGVAPEAPISVEVMSDELWAQDPVEIGRCVGQATRSCLDERAGRTR